MGRFLLVLMTVSLFVGCSDNHFKKGRYFAGGIYASADQLNLGKSVYTEYCMACHGVEGDGKGVASKGLVPPPRNFKKGIFKFDLRKSGIRLKTVPIILRHRIVSSHIGIGRIVASCCQPNLLVSTGISTGR